MSTPGPVSTRISVLPRISRFWSGVTIWYAKRAPTSGWRAAMRTAAPVTLARTMTPSVPVTASRLCRSERCEIPAMRYSPAGASKCASAKTRARIGSSGPSGSQPSGMSRLRRASQTALTRVSPTSLLTTTDQLTKASTRCISNCSPAFHPAGIHCRRQRTSNSSANRSNVPDLSASEYRMPSSWMAATPSPSSAASSSRVAVGLVSAKAVTDSNPRLCTRR